jgi:crotonobetainyl-CoA:carnitine CoA-transferase CaiB-like acyl-CoA transferase
MATAEGPTNRRYRCSRGEIEIAVANEEQWHALAVCAGRPELACEDSWEAVRTADSDGPTARVLQEMFAEDTAEVWRRRLESHAVPGHILA